jgi:hypothetical protein
MKCYAPRGNYERSLKSFRSHFAERERKNSKNLTNVLDTTKTNAVVPSRRREVVAVGAAQEVRIVES